MNKRTLLILLFIVINVTSMMAGYPDSKANASTIATVRAPISINDITEMRRLYVADDPHENQAVELTKWARLNIDGEGEQIWISDKDEQNGAIFNREDEGFKLITTVRSGFKPSFHTDKDRNHYLMLSGAAGGPSYYTEVFKLQGGKVVEAFTVMEIYGEIDQCSLNGNSIGAEQGKAYLEAIAEAIEANITWHTINYND